VVGFFRWLRQRRGQEAISAGVSGKRSRPNWTVVESVASPAMASVYLQVLQQAGIPVLTKEWGAGAGAMGGALNGVRILVPEDRLGEARDVLGAGRAVPEVDDER
jgi:Putative prokaryotic signal transducing protein